MNTPLIAVCRAFTLWCVGHYNRPLAIMANIHDNDEPFVIAWPVRSYGNPRGGDYVVWYGPIRPTLDEAEYRVQQLIAGAQCEARLQAKYTVS